ncbi:MAG: hypothetical protein HRU36_01515 [Rickettsiales bacterium]|nr:hypothetical protein [Rickettsiales bacterium]
MDKLTIWVVSIVALLFAINGIWDWTYYKKYYSGIEFNKEKWQESSSKRTAVDKPSHGTIRCKMYSDIVKNRVKKKMKLAEVKAILGEPDLEYYCYGSRKIKCIKYFLGPCYENVFTTKYDYLVGCFNSKHEAIRFGDKLDLDKKFCSRGKIYCEKDGKCRCFIEENGKISGGKCDFEVDRW